MGGGIGHGASVPVVNAKSCVPPNMPPPTSPLPLPDCVEYIVESGPGTSGMSVEDGNFH